MSTQSRNLDDLENMIADRQANDRHAASNEFDIRIARDGTWYHEGDPIKRIALVKLFSTVLRRDEQGEYWLVTPVERGRIEVEDAPFVAVELMVESAGKHQILTLRTNLDHMVRMDAEHPLRVSIDPQTGEPAPYIRVRDNLEALVNRPVFYELVELAEEKPDADGVELGVWSAGTYFPLGRADE